MSDQKKKDNASGGTAKDEKSTAQTEYLRKYLSRSLGLSPQPDKVLEDLTLDGVAKFIADGKSKNIVTLSGAGMSTSEWLLKMKEEERKNRPPQMLYELSIAGVTEFILQKKCSKVITMAGAGISTSAGIPDFRSPRIGLYDNLEQYNLPTPQSVFDIEYFKGNQEPFYALAKDIWPGNYKPTPCHYFIRMLDNKGLLLRHYTQNIDSLEFTAGIEPDRVVEAHGTFRFSHCINCKEAYKQDWIEEKVFAGVIPVCEGCGGPVKPDIVFFGEDLPVRFKECVEEDFDKCDLLIILGTSLNVQPFASLTNKVRDIVPRLYINMEKTGTGGHPVMALVFGGGFKFDDEDNYRDVFWKGTCDAGCYKLADLCGWGDEFKKMVKDNNERMDKEIIANKKRHEGINSVAKTKKKVSVPVIKKDGDSTDKSKEKTTGSNSSQGKAEVVVKGEKKSEKSSASGTSKFASNSSLPKTSGTTRDLSNLKTGKSSAVTKKKV